MSLLGALSLGRSALAAHQTGLQVTGNNIANAATEGYTRQTVHLTPGSAQQIAAGQFLGTGVNVAAIERQANNAINASLRDATSDLSAAQTLDTLLARLETTFGALGENDLSARLTSFFNAFSTLSTNPANEAQRAVVIQNGVSLADYIQSLRSALSAIRTDAQDQVSTLVTKAHGLAASIANLNGQIATAEAGQGGAANLRDQRDQALTELAGIMDIRVIEQPNGTVNVLVGSMPLITGTSTRGVSFIQTTDISGQFTNTQVTFGDNNDHMAMTGGTLGTLISARDRYLTPALRTIDTLATGLISAVNAIHSQGQGLSGFSRVTGTTIVTDPTAALNAAVQTGGITFPPVNGTFDLYIKDTVTGEIQTRRIAVELSGQGPESTLHSLAADITSAGGGVVLASAGADGRLAIASNNPNVTFTFGEDSSGILAALGINTFFTGTSAANIAVNGVLTGNLAMLAAGRGNVQGSNANALALALAGSATVSELDGKNITQYYTGYIGTLAAHARNASDDVVAQGAIRDTLFAQQQAVSGVSLDEEAINLTRYQRAFQGTARYITVVDELLQTVLGLVR